MIHKFYDRHGTETYFIVSRRGIDSEKISKYRRFSCTPCIYFLTCILQRTLSLCSLKILIYLRRILRACYLARGTLPTKTLLSSKRLPFSLSHEDGLSIPSRSPYKYHVSFFRCFPCYSNLSPHEMPVSPSLATSQNYTKFLTVTKFC